VRQRTDKPGYIAGKIWLLAKSAPSTRHPWGGGLAGGRPISPRWNLELRGMYEQLDSSGWVGKESGEDHWSHWNNDWKTWSVGVDALYFFRRDGFQPFVFVGAGGIRDEVRNRNAWSPMGDAGAGFLYPIGERVLLRTDLRYRWDDNSDSLRNQGNLSDGIATVGLQIPLGAKPRAVVAVAPAPRPVATPPPPPPPMRHIELSADALFAFDKATLMPRGVEELDKLVRDLGGFPTTPSWWWVTPTRWARMITTRRFPRTAPPPWQTICPARVSTRTRSVPTVAVRPSLR